MVCFTEESKHVWDQIGKIPRPSALVKGDFKKWLLEKTNFLESASVMERLWHVVHNSDAVPMCPICLESTLSWRKESAMMRYSEFCSSKCANLSGRPSARRKTTCIERYEVDHPSKVSSVREKVRETNLAKYGVANTFQVNVEERVNAMRETKNSKRDVSDVPDLIEQNLTQREIGSVVGLSQVGTHHLLKRLGLRTTQAIQQSSHERMVLNLLDEYNIAYTANDRSVIAPYELDIFIPSHNLAIEINGVYWHGELHGRGRRYHLTKTEECEKLGIQLLQFFDNECIQQPEIVKSMILSKLGLTDRIFGRKTVVAIISNELASSFFNANHLQGHINAKTFIGLYYGKQLVSVGSFGKPRYSSVAEWELYRFASVLNTTVIGGMSKILAHFSKMTSGASLLSYANRRFSVGKSYTSVGFQLVSVTKPNYYYFSLKDTSKLLSRILFQKHKLPFILSAFDPNLTEWENMQLNQYDRIWDCGNIALIKRKPA